MCGPAFDPDASLALPEAMIAVMGPQAAVNAVYAKKLAAIESDEERTEEVARLQAEYAEDINVYRLAGELVVDQMVPKEELRAELVTALRRLRLEGRRADREEAQRHARLIATGTTLRRPARAVRSYRARAEIVERSDP